MIAIIMPDVYLWSKAIHVIAVIAWMAGLLYLPRLFVYHAAAEVGGPVSEQLKVMERRLASAIMRPAALLAWLSGVATAWLATLFSPMPAWLMAKLAAVAALTIFHGILESHLREFARDLRRRREGYFRIVNEIPT